MRVLLDFRVGVLFREYVSAEESHSTTLARVQVQLLKKPSHPVHRDDFLQVSLFHESLLRDFEFLVLDQVTPPPW